MQRRQAGNNRVIKSRIVVGAVYDRVFFPKSARFARSQTAPTVIGYFSSTMIARALALTSSLVCVRFGALNRVRPSVIVLTSDLPSGVVDFSCPSARYTTTTSLSWKCMGVGWPGVHV